MKSRRLARMSARFWWLRRAVGLAALVAAVGGSPTRAHAQSGASKASPPASIPTVSLNNVARHGFFYAGGKYVGELGADKESTMGGAMYVEVMVPKQIRSPYPIVFLHGAGQTGVDWLQTPDGRPGWAYNFLDMGYVVYLAGFSDARPIAICARASTARRSA